MKKATVILLAIALLLTGCGGSAAVREEDSGETVIFTDDCGRDVTVPAQISRIVPTGPLAQIVLYAIAPDMFVGLAAKWYDCAEGIVPQEYLALPYFGQLYNTANLNVEELALADPQVIIDIGQTMSSGTEDMQTLQDQTGIPTVFLSASPETMPQTFRKLGALLGREEKAEALAQFCQRTWDRTADILEQVGDNKVDALYVLGEQGLNVLAKGSYHSEMLDMLTNNIALVDNPASKGSGNEVTLEQIALWDPDWILFAPDSIYDTAAEADVWTDLSAIRSGSYLRVPEGPHNWMGSPPSCQCCLGMIWLTAQLYPEYCDYDVKAEILEYYDLFYNCRLTDEQYAQLTDGAILRK